MTSTPTTYVRVRSDVNLFAKTHGSILRALVQVIPSIQSALTARDTYVRCRRRYATSMMCFRMDREPMGANLHKLTELV